MMDTTKFVTDVETCVDRIIETVGQKIVFGMPLALGKPNHLANALYRRAKKNPGISLTLLTALSLEKPVPSSDLEARLMKPIVKRVWDGFVEFDYMKDLRSNRLPANVKIFEFFVKAGGYLDNLYAQQNYISSNYTHAVRDLIDNGMNVIGNLLAPHPEGRRDRFSMSCNPDLTLEACRRLAVEREKGRKCMVVGQVNSRLPYMYGDAAVDASLYDLILDDPAYDFPLFSVPKAAVSAADHVIGLNVSTLIKDNGTLQIGIGSLGDAIAAGLILRHTGNDLYLKALDQFGIRDRYRDLIDKIGGTAPFEKGLYGNTEMLVDVFIKLYEKGILKRKVYDHGGIQKLINDGLMDENITPELPDILADHGVISRSLTEADFNLLLKYGIVRDSLQYDQGLIVCGSSRVPADLSHPETRRLINRNLGQRLQNGVVCHGSFFIGPRDFYESLNRMPEQERRLFSMTGVDYVNQLYGDETLKSLQRKDGRFVNAGMMVTLLGAVVSDGLECGSIVSGVGGQYNFVSMAHALEDGRSIMMLRSTKQACGKLMSNLVFNYGHITIPRHLRDIVVTEYGIADLRGKCDHEVIEALLNIADSRFQPRLLAQAQRAGKISMNYKIPQAFCSNTPEKLQEKLAPFRQQGCFTGFPFGTDYTQEEIRLAGALKGLKNKIKTRRVKTLLGIAAQLIRKPDRQLLPLLHRMRLDMPQCMKEKLMRAAVAYSLTCKN